MRELNHILVPVDFSFTSTNALKYGIEMAKCCNAKLSILHAYRFAHPSIIGKKSPGQELRRILLEKINGEFENLKSSLLSEVELNYDVHSNVGFTEDVIHSMTSHTPVDMVVVGNKGAEETTNVFGSTVTTLVDVVNVPLLTVPGNVSFSHWDNVIIASNKLHGVDHTAISSITPKLKSRLGSGAVKNTTISELIDNYNYVASNDLVTLEQKDFKQLNHLLMNTEEKNFTIPLLVVN